MYRIHVQVQYGDRAGKSKNAHQRSLVFFKIQPGKCEQNREYQNGQLPCHYVHPFRFIGAVQNSQQAKQVNGNKY